MKILYDHQIFQIQRFGGISNMYVNLISNLPSNIKYDISIKDSDNKHLINSCLKKIKPIITYDNFLGGLKFRGKGHIFTFLRKHYPFVVDSNIRNEKNTINCLKKGDFDIFHPTFFYDYFIPYLNGKPYILTIYDMISEKYFPSDHFQTINKRKMANTAAHILTISEKTKEDIVDILHVDESKITVIYLAVPENKKIIGSPIIKEEYILYVGHRNSYKNFLLMIDVLASFLKRHKNLKIVCTGIPFSKEEQTFFMTKGVSDQLIHFFPSDDELINLYKYAQCFIYPSLYEGFGIPILEAWQNDCPVLLNNKSCFPEIAQDAAIFFNLDKDYSNLEDVIEHFFKLSDTERLQLLNTQRKRLADFSWKKSANQLADMYSKILY